VEVKAMYTIQIMLPFILPFFPIVVSCMISVLQLKRDSTNSETGSIKTGKDYVARTMEPKRSATITIIILTVAYIIFNAPYCLIKVDDTVFYLSEKKIRIIRSWFKEGSFPYYLEFFYFFTIYSIPLNSTVNPVIYILRIKNLQLYIWRVLTCKRGTASRTHISTLRTVGCFQKHLNPNSFCKSKHF
jgi:hypothetical protein